MNMVRILVLGKLGTDNSMPIIPRRFARFRDTASLRDKAWSIETKIIQPNPFPDTITIFFDHIGLVAGHHEIRDAVIHRDIVDALKLCHGDKASLLCYKFRMGHVTAD